MLGGVDSMDVLIANEGLLGELDWETCDSI